MGKIKFSRMLDSLCLAFDSNTCFCINSVEAHEDDEVFDQERKPLFGSEQKQVLTIKDAISAPQSLALLMKPKTVVLKVSMHCNGCAKKVEKHISKIDGVMSYKVDLESKMVVVIGDILPFEVLESVSKVKNAQLWTFGI
ncbi:heavy metal-associated isoprenylated plant protein 35-like [Amaranthus tricolor]|uniref:heavy metal-associated isoprenylated plant protein 35-like n=1 Tax=Amaranthus tricolor TaxID=29722 RepID=UPI0025842E59|nr:heavy metal-associated isoprenylated plant protein 35-like [Amaranthus tricolor]